MNGRVSIMMVLLSLLAFTGCASAPSYPLREHQLSAIAPEELPGGLALPQAASFAKWPALASRLKVDVPRAVKRADWGLLDMQLPAPAASNNQQLPLRAEALLPDNRTAVIHAWMLGENEVAAAVLVGRFGDEKAQQAFLQMLADTLADKPKPTRGGTFTLP